MSARLSLLLVVAALVAVRSGAADPPPKGAVITIPDCGGGWARPSAYAATFMRVLEAARGRLTVCHELALAEDPRTAAEVDVVLHVAPNGEVLTASLASRGAVAAESLACFRRAALNLQFDAPGASGATLHAPLLLGEAPRNPRPALPLRADNDKTISVELPPMRLTAPAPASAVRAVRAAVRAVAACAASNPPKSAASLDAQLLVTDAGDLAKLEATTASPEAEALARCASSVMTGARGHVVRVALALSVTREGEVSLAGAPR